MFSVQITLEKFENAINTGKLDLCLMITRAQKSRDYRDVIVFQKPRFQNDFAFTAQPNTLKGWGMGAYDSQAQDRKLTRAWAHREKIQAY